MIFVETLTRHHDVIERFRVAGDFATIGRAYDNDVVLSDSYVAPHHLRIARLEDGTFEAGDLGTTNGLLDATGKRVERALLDGDTVIRIGHTLLRARSELYSVEPERTRPPARRQWWVASWLATALVAILLAETWLHETGETRATTFLYPVLIFAAIVLVWTTLWALVSRLFSGSARFATHLAIALAGMLVLDAYLTTTGLVHYAVSAKMLADLAYVGLWAIAGGTALFHLRAIGPRNLGAKVTVLAALVALGIGTQSLMQADSRRVTGEEATAIEAWPPSFRLAAPQSAAHFFGDVDALRASLERARLEPPQADDRPLRRSVD